jgi:putative phosphoesterase
MNDSEIVVGIISDTHGLVRPQALDALRGSKLIIHAGDIGNLDVIYQLRAVAPTIAVRGNVDTQAWAADFPVTEAVKIGQLVFWVLHDIAQLDLDPAAAGFAAIVFGHSHQPSIETQEGVLYINPGSAGPRRFKLPVTVARVSVTAGDIRPEIVSIDV